MNNFALFDSAIYQQIIFNKFKLMDILLVWTHDILSCDICLSLFDYVIKQQISQNYQS